MIVIRVWQFLTMVLFVVTIVVYLIKGIAFELRKESEDNDG